MANSQNIEQQPATSHELLCVCGCTWEIKSDGSEELISSTKQPADKSSLIKLIHAWQAIEETSDILSYHDDYEKRMDIGVMRSAWTQMDDIIRDLWEEMGRP